ncbi:MarR family winged helix-turn-helix transcriptional regulator [Streptomyces sp. VRA16 Mangrove soil]|uniref:MarR family winged helix-turn-helix transcriptional regulator n=1 Tax=Streptomyces sp. VRA16 Mangrove soil TaxID=2817434 RepID=UPI001A9D22C4|nr:MarR family transcriptional regulator [Streptomyces sp. VRA16 Mangrove soil]MBO1333687.1 MarR family transcriptional regulator [Streptomyces sp. VRA16 Mangrove soil]
MLLSRHGYLFGSRARSERWHLDRSAYILLSRIQMDGPMSIGQLSDAFGLDASTLNRQTAAMMREGLVERIPDPEGGVARKFRITRDGAAALDADRGLNLEVISGLLDEWTPEEIAGFATSLERLNRAIERLEGRPWPRP